jgi:hypothetical protein
VAAVAVVVTSVPGLMVICVLCHDNQSFQNIRSHFTYFSDHKINLLLPVINE